MLIIGLTGGIGSGKTTVAEIFQSLGITVIDTDIIARQLVELGQPAYKEIISTFDNIVDTDQQIDRNKLRDIVFDNPEQRTRLEQILHPRIQEQVKQRLASCSGEYVVVVVPLLVEKGKWSFIDRVLVVDCEPEQQLKRAMKRDGASASQIRKILQSQASREQRLACADDIIENQQDRREQLVKQVQMLDHKYRQLA
jgi:dephospho-CoA kinase